MAQTVLGSNCLRTLLQDDEQEGEDNHDHAVKLCQPCNDDGGEATAAGGGGGDGVGAAGHGNEAGQTADSTGDNDGADVCTIDADTGITSGILRVTDNGNLITVLGIFKIATIKAFIIVVFTVFSKCERIGNTYNVSVAIIMATITVVILRTFGSASGLPLVTLIYQRMKSNERKIIIGKRIIHIIFHIF